jgi:hypothetical protein
MCVILVVLSVIPILSGYASYLVVAALVTDRGRVEYRFDP